MIVKLIITTCLITSIIAGLVVTMVVVDDGKGGNYPRYNMRTEAFWFACVGASLFAFLSVFDPDLS